MIDLELEEACKNKFISYSTERLIKRMEAAPDFGYDDEEIELNRRLRLKGQHYKWEGMSNPKIVIFDVQEVKA